MSAVLWDEVRRDSIADACEGIRNGYLWLAECPQQDS